MSDSTHRGLLPPPPRRRTAESLGQDQRLRLRRLRPQYLEAVAVLAAASCTCEHCRSRAYVGAVIDLVNAPVTTGEVALLVVGNIQGLLLPLRNAEDTVSEYESLRDQITRAGVDPDAEDEKPQE